MDVILLERIEKLGAIGDVVKVKNGYARNFLLPRGKALRANDSNRKVFEANREKIEAQNVERRRRCCAIYVGRIGLTDLLTRSPGPPEPDPNLLHHLVQTALVEAVSTAHLPHHRAEPRDRRVQGK